MIPKLSGADRRALLISAPIVAAAVFLVALSLRRPEPPSYPPSDPAPSDAGPALAGPIVYTVDASDDRHWRFFDFSRGALVERPGPLEWDLAFRRFHVIANGGPGFLGGGGILRLHVPFDSVRSAPPAGYAPNAVRSDTTNPGIGKWYRYSFTSHLLTPDPATYALRTADARYAKFEILSYYCPGAWPGCLTFRYVYQGNGSRDFTTMSY